MFNKKWNAYQKEMNQWLKDKKAKEKKSSGGNFYNTALVETTDNLLKQYMELIKVNLLQLHNIISFSIKMKSLKKLYQKAQSKNE